MDRDGTSDPRRGLGTGEVPGDPLRRTHDLGRDGRLSGAELCGALVDGLNAAGANAVDVGMVPTPLAYFAAHHLGCASAAMVTGSHNPPEIGRAHV